LADFTTDAFATDAFVTDAFTTGVFTTDFLAGETDLRGVLTTGVLTTDFLAGEALRADFGSSTLALETDLLETEGFFADLTGDLAGVLTGDLTSSTTTDLLATDCLVERGSIVAMSTFLTEDLALTEGVLLEAGVFTTLFLAVDFLAEATLLRGELLLDGLL